MIELEYLNAVWVMNEFRQFQEQRLELVIDHKPLVSILKNWINRIINKMYKLAKLDNSRLPRLGLKMQRIYDTIMQKQRWWLSQPSNQQ